MTDRVWAVRAGREGQAEELNVTEGIVSIGWAPLGDVGDVDSRDELSARVLAAYPQESIYRRGNWVGQIWRFLREIEVGDLVLMPRKGLDEIHVGRIVGHYAYRAELPDYARHTRPVEWHGSIARSDLGTDLRNTLGSLLTVFEVRQDGAEERLMLVLGGAQDPGGADGELPGAAVARTNDLLRAACVVLADADGPVPVKEVIGAVKELEPPTEQELTTNASGAERYDTNLRWWSVGLVKAGWIVKEQGRWGITESGRQALIDFPDAQDFGREVTRLYQEWQKGVEEKKKARLRYEVMESLVARIPAGRWTTFTEVGEVTGLDVTEIGRRLWEQKPQGWHRVLRADGRTTAEHYGSDSAPEHRALLEADGIHLDPSAPQERFIAADELRELIETVEPARRAWLVRGSSVKGKNLVPEWLDEGFISLPASQLGALASPYEVEAINAAVESGYADTLSYARRAQKARELRGFLLRMRIDDLVITTRDGELYVGDVSGEPEFVASSEGRSNLRRSVSWLNADSPADYSDVGELLKARLRASGDLAELTDISDEITSLLTTLVDVPDEKDNVAEVVALPALRRLTDEEAAALHMPAGWLNELVDLLVERKQVILYGPPGTGKTFLAQKVAALAANPDNVRLVQFHPAYSYEDFFEGYRPVAREDGQIAFELRPGPFRRIVDDAKDHPEQAYILIVDEINRGNLAKIFGELYFLLEYRDQPIELLYAERDAPPFTLPKNVYLIGTMNTADRSIALVDAAMRRRFAFLSLHPDDDHVRGVLPAWLAARDRDDTPARLLAALNSVIPDDDFKIGPSYLMNDASASEAGLERIWRTSILPLLEEFHFGDGVKVPQRYGLSTLRHMIQPDEPAAEPTDVVAATVIDLDEA